MAPTTRFKRLFNNRSDDTAIPMASVSIPGEINRSTSQPSIPKHNVDSSRTSIEDSSSVTPGITIDENSSQLLFQPSLSHHATAIDHDSSTSLPKTTGSGESRQRHGFRSNVQQIWRSKTLGIMSRRSPSTFDGNLAQGKPGWWHKQMLVDRSLRSMALFMAVCAIVMSIIVCSYVPAFSRRLNNTTTSVGGNSSESCRTAERRNTVIHLIINCVATMVLGCSNTYQQLVTALKVDEIGWVLRKRGDSQVGTNSPWSINHKKTGKVKAWLCWWILILTSFPVHFLANSVIGPSFYISMPTSIVTTEYSKDSNYSSLYVTRLTDAACWTAFRANQYVLPKNIEDLSFDYKIRDVGESTTFKSVDVKYTPNCAGLLNTGSTAQALTEFNLTAGRYESGLCQLGLHVVCELGDKGEKECKTNVRMQAAIILAGCLIVKAIYMIGLNFQARHRTKDHCLTIGDVIVASTLDPELKVQNECMLNSGDGFRSQVTHACHKHCKDPIPSRTGDTIGHCQKCKKFNQFDMFTNLPRPTIAIKYKRSLLSNLGSTAIAQMVVLMISSLAMLAASLVLIVTMVDDGQAFMSTCLAHNMPGMEILSCKEGKSKYMAETYGTWGGFSSSATLATLSPNKLSSELMAFAISNGAQFFYSLLYLVLIYNLSLISMEHEWGQWETNRKKPRCTFVSGKQFKQSYFLQLPSKVILPLMGYAALIHWLLGQAIATSETIFKDETHQLEHSFYFVTYAAYPIFLSTILMVVMTAACWWAFTYTREGFIPQMFGSIRTLCASTTELTDFNPAGIKWGDLGMGEKFRHAGFSSDQPSEIVPAELYSGR